MQPLNDHELVSIHGGDWDWAAVSAWFLEAAAAVLVHSGAGSI